MLELFTDASTSPSRKIAIGAFIFFTSQEIKNLDSVCDGTLFAKISRTITYKNYNSHKSTWSEIITVIQALKIVDHCSQIILYTDCQTVCDLMGKRKIKLAACNFMTRSGKKIQNAELYQQLFTMINNLDIQAVKIKGHSSKSKCISIQERIFGIVDKLTRRELRRCIDVK